MTIVKKCAAVLFWLLILALLLAPLGLIFQISRSELAEYQTPERPVLQQAAVGGIAMATRTSVDEYVTVSGTFTSETYVYVEMEFENPSRIRWEVSTGSEVQEGQVLGYLDDEPIVSTVTGILTSIHLNAGDSYLKFRLFAPVVLSCRVDERTLSALEKRAESLITLKGEKVTLLFASQQKNPDGTINVRLSVDTDRYTYGEVLEGLKIQTGRSYQGVVVLPLDCVYQKVQGDAYPWYVRQVTEDGIFVQEVEVEIGYISGNQVCVNGIAEGTYYDTGYKAVAGG